MCEKQHFVLAGITLKIWKYWNSMFMHKHLKIHMTWRPIWQCWSC